MTLTFQSNICHTQGAIGMSTYERNKNCQLSGSGYQGRINGNRNSKMYCEDATVQLLDNTNMNAKIVSSTVTAKDQSNCKLLARAASNIEMKSDRNMDIVAAGVWCKFENNNNLDFEGTGGIGEFLSEFIGNRNSKFRGSDNNILAFKNRNLLIEGNNNHLEISDTRNHDVRPASTGSNR